MIERIAYTINPAVSVEFRPATRRTTLSAYTIALFLHISGVLGYFMSTGTRVFVLAALRRAQRVEQVRLISMLDARLGPVFGISVLVLLVSGLYMAATAWSFQTSWIAVALISLLLMAPVGAALMEPRRRAVEQLAHTTPDGPIPADLAQRINDPVWHSAIYATPILLLGIVFLMAIQPGLITSLIVMGIALGLGSGVGVITAGRGRQQATAEHAA